MTRPVCLIANPSAGGGRTAKLLPAVESALRGHGIAFRVERTHSIEHARELARSTIAAGSPFGIWWASRSCSCLSLLRAFSLRVTWSL